MSVADPHHAPRIVGNLRPAICRNLKSVKPKAAPKAPAAPSTAAKKRPKKPKRSSDGADAEPAPKKKPEVDRFCCRFFWETETLSFV